MRGVRLGGVRIPPEGRDRRRGSEPGDRFHGRRSGALMCSHMCGALMCSLIYVRSHSPVCVRVCALMGVILHVLSCVRSLHLSICTHLSPPHLSPPLHL